MGRRLPPQRPRRAGRDARQGPRAPAADAPPNVRRKNSPSSLLFLFLSSGRAEQRNCFLEHRSATTHDLPKVWFDLGGDRSAFKHRPTDATMIPYFSARRELASVSAASGANSSAQTQLENVLAYFPAAPGRPSPLGVPCNSRK